MHEDRGTILGSDVGPLAIPGGGIVECEKEGQQIPVGDHRRIEGELDRLGVTGQSGADLFIGGIDRAADDVAGHDPLRPAVRMEYRLEATEAYTVRLYMAR